MKKIYLAIPYTGMEESSYEQVTKATAEIISSFGVNVLSPITHSHPLTKYGLKGTWDFWQKIDFQFIEWCDEVWILIPKEGVQKVKDSVGVQSEIEYAITLGKPVKYITIQTTIKEYNI
jgi:nucleoside 2-deoxyribosyltransferase